MYHKPEMGAPLLERLRAIVGAPFTRVSYTDAITHLQSAVRAGKEFKYEPVWGEELQTEHERHLCEVTFKGPVIVHDYPKVRAAQALTQTPPDPALTHRVAWAPWAPWAR